MMGRYSGSSLRAALVGVLAALVVVPALPAAAQEPAAVAPTQDSVAVRPAQEDASVAVAHAPEPVAVTQASVAVGQAQEPQFRPDAFLDSLAPRIYASALRHWSSLDTSVVRYTALIQQRIAADLRTPLKDRTIYRAETAVRAFWDKDYDAVLQVLGTRSQYPGRDIAVREGDLDWLEDMPFDEPFEPGGDRLFFGMVERDDEGFRPRDDDFWFAHPLGEGADSLYRFKSGDTLTLSLPDGRQLRAVQLDVLPREADVHRITGTLWIEPESGALVRAVYRLSRRFDAIRDIPELQEEDERGEFKYVPGLFKPWTFDLSMVAVEYGLWNFEVWLPRSMRLEGEVAAGILKMPVSMDLSYQIESVTTANDLVAEAAGEGETGARSGLKEVHFATRAEAMAFISDLLSQREGFTYETMGEAEEAQRGRESLLIVPQDRTRIATSPHLPPPIWEESAGFPSDQELEQYVETLANLPAPPVEGLPINFNWGWARPDLIRYNRVEGPAVGGTLDAAIGGPYSLVATGYFGFADLRPKVRLNLQRSTVLRRLTLGAYYELQATDPMGKYLGFGNSAYAFFFGRDDGEYFRAYGADLTWRPPVDARESFLFRAYAERQEAVEKKIDFALFRVFDGGWEFRPNVAADDIDEAGAELRLSPWWGTDPYHAQFGLELYGQGARYRITGESGGTNYGRASATLRVAIPLAKAKWRVGMEAGGGHTWGDAPMQRTWFMGGARTLRGYPASTLFGPTFGRGRVEVARVFDIGTATLFGDAGWAGVDSEFDSGDILYAVGLGGSVLDGLIRFDLSHGLTGPAKQFRIDLYVDAIL